MTKLSEEGMTQAKTRHKLGLCTSEPNCNGKVEGHYKYYSSE